MAGIGPLWQQTKELAARLNIEKAIDFAGVLTHEQVYERMKHTRAFVQHSVTAAAGDSEGTPNSILEASAAGLPVVRTSHAGIDRKGVVKGKRVSVRGDLGDGCRLKKK